LIMLPDCARPPLPEGWLTQAEGSGACVIDNLQHRDQWVAAALQRLDGSQGNVEPDLVADFLALGICHLQVELLTRQLRYMSNLDEESFRSATLSAADDALQGDCQSARKYLQSAFDLLHESREYFYPVEAHLLDLTLVAPTTLGESLRAELASDLPTNLLISGEVVAQMAREEPATLAALAEALQKDRASIVGGEFSEVALSLLGPEAVRYHLLKGLDSYQRHLGRRPRVFGRRRFGLSPVLPQLLKRQGFTGAMHSTLDDGRFPTSNQSRIQWEGIDGTALEAIARVPLDVGRADAFLRLPERLGDAMDLDHVATVVLAHWPGQSSPWYEDLRRIASYSSAIGTFSTIDDYFDQTGMSGQQTQYRTDQYRSPYLKQAVAAGQADPISRWVRYFIRHTAVETLQSLGALAIAVGGSAQEPNANQLSPSERLFAAVEDRLVAEDEPSDELDRQIEDALDETAGRFARCLGGGQQSNRDGCLIINPCNFARRLCVEMPHLSKPPEVAGAVRAAAEKSVVVDVPAMGFAWVGPGSETTRPPSEPPERGLFKRKKKPKEEPPLAEDCSLRNEFFEVAIDPHTGAIKSISDYYSRGARLAQQIAMRTSPVARHDEGDDAGYSIMAADEVTVTSPGPILGEIVCRGRLVDRQARRLAGFVQTTRIRRGSRVIELQIDLDVEQFPDNNPWHSYYAARLAWNDATANLYRSANLANLPTDAALLEAPHFIDVRAGKTRTTLLCGGLPYHRRFGLRKLDSLLIVGGETARSFRLGIGIDLPNPMPAALDFLTPATTFSAAAPPPAPSGWLYHLDCRNVIATHWEPWLSDGRMIGYRVRLLETDGRKVTLGLRSFRPVQSAQEIKPGDTPPRELTVEGDRVEIPIGPHQWMDVAARFAD